MGDWFRFQASTILGLCLFLPTSLTSDSSKVGWTFWGSCNRFCWVGFPGECWLKHVFSTRRDTTWLLGPFLKTKNPQVSMAMMALKFSFSGNTKAGSNKKHRGKFTNVAGCRSPSNVPPPCKAKLEMIGPLVHLGLEIGTSEPRKNKTSSFPLHWLFNRDPYFMVYEIIPV